VVLKKSLPIHLIAGPLGVGKTSAILDYLKRSAGWEKVGVVVNDFGPLGMDDAILEGGGARGQGSEVVMIPGGCVCCTAAAGLVVGLEKVLKTKGLTRVIIEPSGIAAPSDVIDTLRTFARTHDLEIMPVIGMLDACDAVTIIEGRMPLYSKLVESADHLVFNRSDLAGEAKVAKLKEWAAGLYPPKLSAAGTHHGMLPDALFEPADVTRPLKAKSLALSVSLGSSGESGKAHHGHTHGHDHPTDHSDGLLWPAEVMFRHDKLGRLFVALMTEGVGGVKPIRVKGIFSTDEGWVLIEVARDQVFERPTEYRRDSRVDWITAEGTVMDKELVTGLMEGCRID
jgi:G3E family GTPase